MFKKLIILLSVLLLVGCASEAVRSYESCIADQQCAEEMAQVQNDTYNSTLVTTASTTGLAPMIAVLVSNLVAFAFGAWRGKKKGK